MSVDWRSGALVRIGEVTYRLRSPVPEAVRHLVDYYGSYPPDEADAVAEFAVTIDYTTFARRFVRRQVHMYCDIEAPFVPLPASLAPVSLEMAMNLQAAVGINRWLLLHSSCVARGGRAVLMSAESGSGKSTLSAILGYSGWDFMGDEFSFLDPATDELIGFPRPLSLKNQSVAAAREFAPEDAFSRIYAGTVKGDISYLRAPPGSTNRPNHRARPALILFPRFTRGGTESVRPVEPSEVFLRLTTASTNYARTGERGFSALHRLVTHIPAFEIGYGSSDAALRLVAKLAADAGVSA